MFFVRVAFWALLVIILLPSNTQEKQQFYGTAQRSMSDATGFCDRNADLCEGTTAFFYGIYQKLATTTELIEELLRDSGLGNSGAGDAGNNAGDDNPNGKDLQRLPQQSPYPQRQGKTNNLNGASTASMSQNTLTRADLVPSWQGPGYDASGSRRYR